MNIVEKINNKIGDFLDYARCDNCGNTFFRRNEECHILINRIVIYNDKHHCNKCPIPKGDGRLYIIRKGVAYPANDEAMSYERELKSITKEQ